MPKVDRGLKQLHVNIPSTLHRKFRVRVLEEGRSMGEVIEDLLEDYVNQQADPATSRKSNQGDNSQ
jgi:plasmid stability protein